MTRPSIDRTEDMRVAEALGWHAGVWHGLWVEDVDAHEMAGLDSSPDTDTSVGWLLPDGSLRRTLPAYGGDPHYVPTMLRWLRERASVTIRPRGANVIVQAWSRDGVHGWEVPGLSIPHAVRQTVIALLDHDERLASDDYWPDDEDEDEDDGGQC